MLKKLIKRIQTFFANRSEHSMGMSEKMEKSADFRRRMESDIGSKAGVKMDW